MSGDVADRRSERGVWLVSSSLYVDAVVGVSGDVAEGMTGKAHLNVGGTASRTEDGEKSGAWSAAASAAALLSSLMRLLELGRWSPGELCDVAADASPAGDEVAFPFTTPGGGGGTGPPNGSIFRPLVEAVAGNWCTNLKPLAGIEEDDGAAAAPGPTSSGSGRFPRRPSQFNLIL